MQLEEEEATAEAEDGTIDEQLMIDQKIAMEAQDAELARMLQDKERAKARRARERAKQKKLEKQQLQLLEEQNAIEKPQRPDKLDLKIQHNNSLGKVKQPIKPNYSQYPDPEEIQVLESPLNDVKEMPNVAAMIDPTYNVNTHRSSSSSSSNATSPAYVLPTPPLELMDEDAPCYMPIQGQRRNQIQSPAHVNEEKQKRRVKDGCKHQ